MKRSFDHVLPKSTNLLISLSSIVTKRGDLRYLVEEFDGDNKRGFSFENLSSAIDFIKCNFS